MTRIAVIVPYFQRQAGLLRRCVLSAAGQATPGGAAISLIVVDDGSPVAARAELAGMSLPAGVELKIVEQANRGAPAARNAGLDAAAPDTTFVAFLDSDDVWRPGHLMRALESLGETFDVYFCDHVRESGGASHFEAHDARRLLGRPAGDDDGPWDLSGRDMFAVLLRAYLAQTSTLVFRRAIAPQLRFEEDLDAAGEDHLFLLRLAQATAGFCVSPQCGVECGEGINIYYSSFDWDSERNVSRISCLIKLFETVETSFDLRPDDRRYVEARLRGLRRGLAFFVGRWVVKRGRLPGDFARIRARHRGAWGMLGWNGMLVVADFARGRRSMLEK